jgi:hypothetical protein
MLPTQALTLWTLGATALVATAAPDAHAQTLGPIEQQLAAVVTIGAQQMTLRGDLGVERIEAATDLAITTLAETDDLVLDPQALRLAEMDARIQVRRAIDLAHDDLRGMAVNTVNTLVLWGARPDQVTQVLTIWDEQARRLDQEASEAFADVELATPAMSYVASSAVVPVVAGPNMQAEARLVFETMALEMDAQLRASTDAVVRTLRTIKATDPNPRSFRSLERDAWRDVRQEQREMRRTLRDQYRAYRKAVRRDDDMGREEKRYIRDLYKEAQRVLKDALEDVEADIKAIR